MTGRHQIQPRPLTRCQAMIQSSTRLFSLSRNHLPGLLYRMMGMYHIDNTRMCFALNQMIASFILVAATVELQQADVHISPVYWSLMPVLGAVLASGMAFLLNSVEEGPRAVAGRFIGALVTGVGIPRILTYMHPWLKEVALDPILLIVGGFFCGLMGYAAAKFTVEKFFKDAPRLVNSQMDRLKNHLEDKNPPS